jgi:hypothetical protein
LFLAFLSKEYAITLGLLLPLAFYLFRDYSIPKSIRAFLPYLAVVAIYLFIRIKVAIGDSDQTLPEFFANMRHGNENSDKEILNNPYYFATHIQKIATEIATSLNYLKLLIFPHPLSADYSYNSIPYKDFSNWQGSLRTQSSLETAKQPEISRCTSRRTSQMNTRQQSERNT